MPRKIPLPNTSTVTLTRLPSASFSGFLREEYILNRFKYYQYMKDFMTYPNLAVSGSNSRSSRMGDFGTEQLNCSISGPIIL